MKEEEIRKKELKARLSMVYSQGLKQPQLFKLNGYKENKEAIKFRELIDREAKKRKVKPLELIDYFVDNKEELIDLQGPINGKQFRPISGTESLVPHYIMKISKMVNITQLSERDYRGTVNTLEYGEMEKWENGITYLVKKIDFWGKMDRRLPKPNAYLDKVIKVLIYLIQQEASKSDTYITQARGSFYLLDMAKFLNVDFKELRRTLITGACIVYEYPHKINGVDYKYYGSWYDMEVPKDNKHPWFFEFHGVYRDQICDVINSGRQYLKHPIKEITDRKTHKKEYLHSFYNNLTYNDLPITIEKLLTKMGIKKDRLYKPKKCFEIIKDCLVYFNENYPEDLSGFYISKYYRKPKTGVKDKILINISEAFKTQSYEEFKEFLNSRGIEDIRKAYIQFKKPYKEKTKHFILTESDKSLIDEIMTWAKEWEEYIEENKIPYTEKQRYKFLSDCIRYLGHDKVEDSFIEEKEREKEGLRGKFYNVIDPIGYFTQRLPELLKEDKESKQRKYVNN